MATNKQNQYSENQTGARRKRASWATSIAALLALGAGALSKGAYGTGGAEAAGAIHSRAGAEAMAASSAGLSQLPRTAAGQDDADAWHAAFWVWMQILWALLHPQDLLTSEPNAAMVQVADWYDQLGWPPGMTPLDKADAAEAIDALLVLLKTPPRDIDPAAARTFEARLAEMRDDLYEPRGGATP